jgi:hypothetical protein
MLRSESKTMKNGKEVPLVVGSSSQIQERH